MEKITNGQLALWILQENWSTGKIKLLSTAIHQLKRQLIETVAQSFTIQTEQKIQMYKMVQPAQKSKC